MDKFQIILNASIKVFAGKGFFNATIKEIAQKAALSEGTIYNYFKNKDDLLDEIHKSIWSSIIPKIQDEIRKIKNPDEQMKKIVLITLNTFYNNKELTKVFMLEMRKSSNFGEEKTFRLFGDFINLIINVLQLGIDQGIYRKNINLRILPGIIFGSINGILFSFMIPEVMDHITLEEVKEVFMQSYFRIVR